MSSSKPATAKPSGKEGKSARKYSLPTTKILFALSGNQCAHPHCPIPVIENATEESEDKVLAQISHIYAHSDVGPRGKPGMTEAERNHADNLMLFCPTHHVVVDKQHETYPATLLLEWKQRHERRSRDKLSIKLTDIGYAELEVAARALQAPAVVGNGDYGNIPPAQKIKKNNLGSTSTMLLTLGAAKSKEVERVLLDAAQLDPSFPDRLRNGFVAKYDTL